MARLLLVRRTHPVLAPRAALLLAVAQAALRDRHERAARELLPAARARLLRRRLRRAARRAASRSRSLLAAVVPMGVIDGGAPGNIFFPAAVVALCWLVGRNVRTRTQLAAELHEAAARLAEQRAAAARGAVAEERRRIAREMHDVVAHSISIMVVQATGARQILPLDAGARERRRRGIGRAGRDALAEMRLLVGALESARGGAVAVARDAPGAGRARPPRRPRRSTCACRRAAGAAAGRRAGRLPGRPGGADERDQARRRARRPR